MTEITILLQTNKNDIDPSFFVNLDHLAQQYGLQIKQSTRAKIDPAPLERKLNHEEFIRRAIEISRKIGPVQSDSTDDIREMRDSR